MNKILVFSLSIVLYSNTYLFCAFEPRPIGARAVALGGAFTTPEDDASAVYWNPAALTTVSSKEIEFTYQDLYSEGLVNFSNLSFVYPEVGFGGFGISWTRFGVTNKVPFDYSENTYSVSYGMEIFPRLSLGTSLSFYRLSSNINGSGFGIDGAMYYRPFSFLSLGFLYHNIGRTTVRFDSGAIDPLPNDIRTGFLLTIMRRFRWYTDFAELLEDPTVHSGLEVPFLDDGFHFRGGLRRRIDQKFDWTYALGFGLKIKSLGLDYAFENHFDLGPSHVVSIKWRF